MKVTITLTDLTNGKVGVDVEASEPFSEENLTNACKVAGRMLSAVKNKEEVNAK